MTRICGCITVALFLCAMPGPARAADKPPADLDQLAWLVGSWIERKQGVETEEHWIAPKGGIMLGVNRTVRAAGKTSFEFLRIARTSSGVSYFASPAGRPATEFPLVEAGDKKAVFENPKHDFPTRILYRLDADGALHGRIEGMIGGKMRSQEWRWERGK
jgi:Domain of unknown function (DUF6265)